MASVAGGGGGGTKLGMGSQIRPQEQQFALCNFIFAIFKLWGLETAVLKLLLGFLGQNDRFLAFFLEQKEAVVRIR